MANLDAHWNAIYRKKNDQQLGWYEEDLSQTFKFLAKITQKTDAVTLVTGAGTSLLVDQLSAQGYHLIINDISDAALDKLRQRISYADKHQWLCHDIAKPLPNTITTVDLWIDRAVLHFLLSEEAIDRYFANIQGVVSKGGFVLLAEFSTTGASQCAGLKVHRYSLAEMQQRLGENFTLIAAEDYNYINPFGEVRPYLYALFQRVIAI